MNLFQVTWSAARYHCAHLHCRLLRSTTTSTLLPVPRNELCYYNRFYCCQRFPSSSCSQYRKPNAMDLERKRLLMPEEAIISSSFFWCFPVRGMAGHSKWQNIKQTKGAKDKERSDLSARFAQRLRIAVKEGGNDPKFNSKLEKLIDDAKRADMTNSMIENAIKGANTMAFSSSIVEVKFLGNCVLVVEIFTSKLQITRNEMQTVCRKNGGKIENGCSEGIFEKKGIVHVVTEKEPDLESALEMAIEVGAEDVSLESDENNIPFLQFICGPKELHAVKKALEAQNHNVTYSEYEYLPTEMYPLDAHGIASLEKLANKLYQHPDVVKIFDNAALLE